MRLVLLALLAVAPVFAQPVTPDVPCRYSDCAIRVEPAFFFGPEIVQGAPGQEIVVGRVGALVGGLEDVVRTSPAALEHAGAARRSRIASLTALVAGGVLVAVGVSQAYSDSIDRRQFDVFYFGGLGLGVVGGVFELKSQREQSRAVWEYNRSLVGE